MNDTIENMGDTSYVPPGSSQSKLDLQSTVTLRNGVNMPRLGFGLWKVDPAICTSLCEMALEAGFRHIDSAQAYENEAQAGTCLRSTKCKREDIFFTTKIPKDLGSFDDNYASLLESVRRINGGDSNGYVDLFLIHSARIGPEGIKNLWTALEKLLKEGKTRSIGVSNFKRQDIEGMKEYATIWPPHVNQIQARYALKYNLSFLVQNHI